MPNTTNEVTSQNLAEKIVEAMVDLKGVAILTMDLRELDGAITDFFVVCTGTSDRHVQSLSERIMEMTKDDLAERPKSVEGLNKGEWVLLDYVNVVAHVFLKEKRSFFNIEELWGDAKFDRIEDSFPVEKDFDFL